MGPHRWVQSRARQRGPLRSSLERAPEDLLFSCAIHRRLADQRLAVIRSRAEQRGRVELAARGLQFLAIALKSEAGIKACSFVVLDRRTSEEPPAMMVKGRETASLGAVGAPAKAAANRGAILVFRKTLNCIPRQC